MPRMYVTETSAPNVTRPSPIGVPAAETWLVSEMRSNNGPIPPA